MVNKKRKSTQNSEGGLEVQLNGRVCVQHVQIYRFSLKQRTKGKQSKEKKRKYWDYWKQKKTRNIIFEIWVEEEKKQFRRKEINRGIIGSLKVCFRNKFQSLVLPCWQNAGGTKLERQTVKEMQILAWIITTSSSPLTNGNQPSWGLQDTGKHFSFLNHFILFPCRIICIRKAYIFLCAGDFTITPFYPAGSVFRNSVNSRLKILRKRTASVLNTY